jgi:hypothetical protein
LLVADLSSNNHPNDAPIIWSDVVGVDAFFIKATQGSNYANPWYGRDLAGAKSINKPALAYHYAGFGDVATELDWFIAHAGPLAAGCDFETSTDAAWITSFLLGLTHSPVVGYGSESTFPPLLPGYAWKAAYGQINPPKACQLWQYTDAAIVPGFPEPIDLSTWIGTQAQWNTLFNVSPLKGSVRVMAIVVNPITGLRSIEGADQFDDTIVITETSPNVWRWDNVTADATGVGKCPKLFEHPAAATPTN